MHALLMQGVKSAVMRYHALVALLKSLDFNECISHPLVHTGDMALLEHADNCGLTCAWRGYIAGWRVWRGYGSPSWCRMRVDATV